jgi:hypothetical protein
MSLVKSGLCLVDCQGKGGMGQCGLGMKIINIRVDKWRDEVWGCGCMCGENGGRLGFGVHGWVVGVVGEGGFLERWQKMAKNDEIFLDCRKIRIEKNAKNGSEWRKFLRLPKKFRLRN